MAAADQQARPRDATPVIVPIVSARERRIAVGITGFSLGLSECVFSRTVEAERDKREITYTTLSIRDICLFIYIFTYLNLSHKENHLFSTFLT